MKKDPTASCGLAFFLVALKGTSATSATEDK